jgi:outer membrane protein OmpA-like peptidoglycan-associated protein
MVPESQIESAYYGEKEAPYDNSSEAERRKNRLVMVVVVGK